MKTNLEYAIYLYAGNVMDLEKDLIRLTEPPINLTLWRNPQKRCIQDLRNACKEEAELVWQSVHGSGAPTIAPIQA